MKTKFLKISVVLVAIIVVNGCMKTNDVSKWQEHKNLGKIWSKVESENVQKIIFCETDVPEIDEWFVRFEVPQEAIAKSIQLMGKALEETKAKRDVWDIKRIKIVTDKGKYIVPVGWTGQKIYGNDWLSKELRDYLRENGFGDPGSNKETVNN